MIRALEVITLLLGLSCGQYFNSNTVTCGHLRERCCKPKDIPEKFRDEQVQYAQFPNNWCWNYDAFCSPVDGKCQSKVDFPCGTAGKRCCNKTDIKSPIEQVNFCFNEDYCYDDMCISEEDLPCGGYKEECCSEEALSSSTNDNTYFFDAPQYQGLEGYCFAGYGEGCINGICERCARPDDPCCERRQLDYSGDYEATPSLTITQSCANELICKANKCTRCGDLGLECCPQVDADGNQLYYEYRTNNGCRQEQECMKGVCQYCGYAGTMCCEGNTCKSAGLKCSKDGMCDECGQRGEQCCEGNKCGEAYLACAADGLCHCGGLGQKCCEKWCEEGLECTGKNKICKRPKA